MARERILVSVKTYPAISRKHTEVVCTAGFREDGSWIRIYPLPFRSLEDWERYKKYQWMELEIEKSDSDPRPESYKVTNIDTIELQELISTGKSGDWAERKNLIFKNNQTYESMDLLIQKANEANELSLAIFKPKEILDFVAEEQEREWDEAKIKELDERAKQGSLFDKVESDFKRMPKLPYKFSYVFTDSDGKKRKMMIEDWEIGQLFLNCLKRHKCEDTAVEKVKEKYFDKFVKEKDLFFFLGTTRQYHGWARNPFVIIGLFYPPKQNQYSLL